MPRYRVHVDFLDVYTIEVEAPTKHQAIRLAEEIISQEVPEEIETSSRDFIQVYAKKHLRTIAERVIED